MSVKECSHECGSHGGQKRALDLLELELQGVVKCLIMGAGT